jgi:oxygen-independent coproporphyrinogen III oxidase
MFKENMDASLYIHVPFCLKKCGYCDFYSLPIDEELVQAYIKGLQQEIKLYSQSHQFVFKTVYLGGGTPSLLSPQQIELILTTLSKYFKIQDKFEFTLEVNPETVDKDKLQDFYRLGVNRLSIGVQSFHDDELKFLGRIHNAGKAIFCIELSQEIGFNNISIDLIYAIPNQTIIKWQENLSLAIRLNPQHISMYGLTFEADTALEKRLRRGTFRRQPEEIERQMYLDAVSILAAHGFHQYEISNFAKEGLYSRHNQSYWDDSSYLGLGPSAHSFRDRHRHWNVRSVQSYIELLNDAKLPIENQEQLTQEQQILEFIMLSLRKKSGLDFQLFQQKFKFDFQERYKHQLDKLNFYSGSRLFQVDENSLWLSTEGFLLYDTICSYFT